MSVVLRAWEPEDGFALSTFQCADPSRPYTMGYQSDIRSGRLLSDAALETQAVVAEDHGHVVGVAIFGPTPRPDTWVVRMVAVARARQREGIGTNLKLRAIEAIAAAGATKVCSEVHEDNAPMRQLNAKLGIDFEMDPTATTAENCFYTAVIELE